jgi:predicted Zn-dependent peptidase
MNNKNNACEVVSEIRKLSGGGRLAIEVMPALESFTVGFFLPIGAAHESSDVNGISHFIEHLLFKGTRRRSARQVVQAIERVGGFINASTGRELTYYYIRVGSSRLDLALDILVDLVFNPMFDPQAIALEKGVILEEMRMTEDDPEQALFDRFLKTCYGNSAFGRPILGSEQSLLSIERDTLVDFHNNYYTQANLVASIAGGVDPDHFQKLIETKLADHNRGTGKKIRQIKTPTFKPSVMAFSKDVEQAALLMGFPSVSIMSPDRYAYTLLDAISAGGMMSRLFQEVREKRGLVYSIDSTQQPYTSGGLFTIEAGTKEENLLKVLRIVFKEFNDLAQSGPGKRELADTKEYLKGHWALGLESSSSRMIRNATSTLFFGKLLTHEEVLANLDAVKRENIAEAASKMFETGEPAVGVISRFDDGETVKATEEKIRSLVNEARATYKKA